MSEAGEKQAQAFLDLLLAAMHDAAEEGKLTQLQTQFLSQFSAIGKPEYKTVRIIVVPDKLSHTWPTVAPAGTPTS